MWSSRRASAALACLALLALAAMRIPPAPAWQGAVLLSRPGQEDLTFWVNHNGLEQLDVEGEVGFGDMARILLRRRSNSEIIRPLRDRCTFAIENISALRTPDVFRAETSEDGLTLSNHPEHLVLGASKTFNLPVIFENHTMAPVQVSAHYVGSTAVSSFPASPCRPMARAATF
jgi:hypothetical protein